MEKKDKRTYKDFYFEELDDDVKKPEAYKRGKFNLNDYLYEQLTEDEIPEDTLKTIKNVLKCVKILMKE